MPGETERQDRFWLAFEEPGLNRLIDSALVSNFNVRSAWNQIKEAQAIVKISGASKIPQVDLQLQSGISRPRPDFVGGENTQLSLGADYEVDLWGRLGAVIQADRYRFEATKYDFQTATISLASEIALRWYRLKAARYQLKLIDDQLETNEKVLALIRARFAGGQVRGVDILRQEQLISGTQALRVSVITQIELLQNQLTLLLGKPPGSQFEEAEAELSELPDLPQTGIPAQLIDRRPDIQSAFYQLQAADRELAAAISNQYPRFNVSILGAIRSNDFENLFQNQAVSLSAGLLQPIFNGGRLRADVDRTESIRQQARYNYGQTVLTAFQEVENALIQETRQKERLKIIEYQAEQADRAYGQLRIEYLNGSLPYLDVLVGLNQAQQLRLNLINEKLALYEIRIALYRALAGGFDYEELAAQFEQIEQE